MEKGDREDSQPSFLKRFLSVISNTKRFKESRVVSVDRDDFDPSKVILGSIFARGAHSKVYHGLYKKKLVAVKMLGDDSDKLFTNEADMLCRLKHRNIIELVGTYKTPSASCIVTEYLTEGSLKSYLTKSEPKSLPVKISMALDIARGMAYVHSHGVIHRDLKPDNILVTEDFHLKIADFGVACEEFDSRFPGTVSWMAPEVLKHKPYDHKVDVYAFGLILWELVSGIKDKRILRNKKLRPAIPADTPPAIKALIEQCWCLQPEKRPEFSEVVKILEEFACSLPRDETSNNDQLEI